MKKIAILFLTLVAIVTATVHIGGASAAEQSLYEWYQSKGVSLPSVSDRVEIATVCGINGYRGTATQNNALVDCLESEELIGVVEPVSEDLLGGTTPRRPTEFKTSIAEQKTQGHGDTTLQVTSITTKDGNTLSTTTLGDLIVLSINPGASNSETVSCTGLTPGTKTFTGCTFGIRFDDPLNSQAANIKAHSPGEPVIISNTDAYLSNQFLTLDGNHTVNSVNTWNAIQTFNSTTFPRLDAYTAPTADTWFAPKKYVDDTAFAGAPDSSTSTKGIVERATGSEAANNTATGGGNTTAPLGITTDITSSTSAVNIVPVTDAGGTLDQSFIDLTDNYSWTGTHDFAATTTFTTSTFDAATITSSTITNLDLGGQNANTLVDGSNADSLHTHAFSALITASTTAISNVGQSTTNEETIYSLSLPGDTLSTGNVVKFRIYATTIGLNASGQVSFRLKYGGSTLATASITEQDGGSVTGPGFIEGTVMASGATNSQKGFIEAQWEVQNAEAGPVTTGEAHGWGNGSLAIDSTANQTLSITVQYSGSSANNQVDASAFFVDVIR